MTSAEPASSRTFGAWGSPAGASRPPRRRRSLRAVALMAAAACLVAVAAVAIGLADRGASGPPHARGSHPDRTRSTIESISTIVAATATDRSRVITAIDGVQSCSLPAAQGEDVIESVIADRRSAVARLERFAASRPAQVGAEAGAQTNIPVVNDLVTTLNASISDDVSYASWMGDIAGGHTTCGADPMTDPNFAAAKAQSDRTNSDKDAFVAAWNPLAVKYGKPTYAAGDF